MAALILFGPCLAAVQDDDIRPPAIREIEDLREEIKALGILQEAEVTREQARRLLEIADEARGTLARLVDEHETEVTEAKGLLIEYRDLLARGEEIPEDLRTRVETLQRDIENALGDLQRRLGEVLRGVRDVLSDEQLAAMMGRTGPDVWGPFRRQLQNGLGAIRRLSDDQFDLDVGDKLERQLEQISRRFGGLGDEEFIAEHDRIMGILREVRGMDDDEFGRRQGGIVQRILGEGKLGEFGRKAAPAATGAGEALAKFLLGPATVQALRKRAE